MSRPHPKPVRIKKKSRRKSAGKPSPPRPDVLLPADHLEWVESWGMAQRTMAHVFRPSTVEGIKEVFDLARKSGRTIAFRGGGCSYGDPFQNEEEIVLDLSRMRRILEWDPQTGLITVEAGITIANLWQFVLGDGWWPPIVSGTMFTTMGGCCAMNIHGKNAYKKGPFGNYVQEFEILLPTGETRQVSRESDPELFRGAISGMGMLGAITKITLQMKKIHSGVLEVSPQRVHNFYEMIDSFEENAGRMDYMVGWADCFPSRRDRIGRGEMHFARQLDPGEDPMPAQTLRLEKQELPESIMGLLPKAILWKLMKPFVNDPGMWMINTAKYLAQFKPGAGKPYQQSHSAFHFLLDYVPNWKNSYRPNGLIQYQSFIPKENAARVFTEQVRLAQRSGIRPYLGVTKKHIPDDYLITHSVDGFSLALDFPVTRRNRERLWDLCHEMDELVLGAGGRFYFAKDLTMRSGTIERYLPAENLQKFHELKQHCDPEGLLSSNLYRRVFGLSRTKESVNKGSGSKDSQFVQTA